MKTHHISLYNSDDNKPSTKVIKQELVTWVETDFGIVKTTLKRKFNKNDLTDTYESEPMVLDRNRDF
jgi:hypothetical protein